MYIINTTWRRCGGGVWRVCLATHALAHVCNSRQSVTASPRTLPLVSYFDRDTTHPLLLIITATIRFTQLFKCRQQILKHRIVMGW